MQYPKISIVTPNYNGAKFLEKTICSICNQNYPNLEYIIIDGGSTDGSLDIIRKYESKLAYWISEPDNGLYHALQKGFDRSTGDIMAWLNSDDMYYPHTFNTISEIFTSLPEIEWLTGLNVYYDEYGRILYVTPPYPFTYFDFLTGNYRFIQQESTVWRRSLWEKAGGRDGYISQKYSYAGDMELWMRFFRYAHLYTTTFYIGGFRYHENQLTQTCLHKYFQEAKSIISEEKLTPLMKKKLKYYTYIRKIERLFKIFKIFNTNGIIRHLKKIVTTTYSVEYDRLKKNYYLTDNKH